MTRPTWVSPAHYSVLALFLPYQLLAGVSRCLTVLARLWHTPGSTRLFHLPRLSKTDGWIKSFRRQVAITCGDGWYVRNNRGRMRLNVPGHSSLSLNFDSSERGATQARPFIQRLFKRWNSGRITLATAATSTNTSSSHQKLDFSQLIETY